MGKVRTKTIPFPVKGWNTRDPLEDMDPQYAVELVNVFPRARDGALRKGFAVHGTGMGTGAVPTLLEYSAETGTRDLIACANGKVYEATVAGAATEIGTGFSENRWQGVNMNSKLLMCNGTDQPQQWDGTTLSAATYTGVTDNNLIVFAVYKSHLYAAEKNSQSIWWVTTGGAITGAMTEYDMGPLLKLGGSPLWVGSWTCDSGDGLEDMLLVCSNMGELLTFQGDNPGATNWSISGRYYIPRPLGRRSLVSYGGEAAIITQYGFIPVSQIVQKNNDREAYENIVPINDAFRQAAELYGDNSGWEAIQYPKGNMLIVNVPLASNTAAEQFVMNALTGAWCRFTGVQATCWGTLNDAAYFGGTDGKVYKFDSGETDNGSAIQATISTAYNYFGDDASIKRFTLLRPFITSTDAVSLKLGVDVDFQGRRLAETATTVGAGGTPWGSPWGSPWSPNESPRAEWFCIEGIGRAASAQLRGDFSDLSLSLSAFSINYELGGMF